MSRFWRLFLAICFVRAVLRFACAEAGDALLSEMGVPCRLRAYPGMEHSACPEELDDLQDFLRERLLP